MPFSARRFASNFLLPIGGFATGWWSLKFLEDNELISAEMQRRMHISNLKMQLAVQRVMPASMRERLSQPEDLLQRMIDTLEKGYSETDLSSRVTFDQIFEECGVPEQLEFLEEHAAEDIPYFYIADIFHSWATVHRDIYVKAADVSADTFPVRRDHPDYDSALLCAAVPAKMRTNVLPFDVSVRALCVLAVQSRKNAQRLSHALSPGEVMTQYMAYMKTLDEKKQPEGDVVPAMDVTAATMLLLHALNEAKANASSSWRSIFSRHRPDHSFPIVQEVDASQWCTEVLPAYRSVMASKASEGSVIMPPAALLAEVLSERLRCPPS